MFDGCYPILIVFRHIGMASIKKWVCKYLINVHMYIKTVLYIYVQFLVILPYVIAQCMATGYLKFRMKSCYSF